MVLCKKVLPRLMMCALTLLVLAACQRKAPEDIAADIQKHYESLQACDMTVEITSDYGDRTGSFTIDYRMSAPGEGVITVKQPPEIAGITVSVTDGGTTLNYDGLILDTGKLTGTALTPVDAVPAMLAAWASGYAVDSAATQWNGVKCYQVTYSVTVEESVVEQQAWFDSGTLKPLHAEVLVDGSLAVSCDFTRVDW